MSRPIYLDHNATTPVHPQVLEAMWPWFADSFGNAASRTHLYGWEAEEAVTTARKQLAKLVNANPKDVVLTSGATEANNLAIKGVFEQCFPAKKHIITVQTEHKAVLDPCAYLETRGATVTYLAPNPDGLVSPEQVANALRPDTALVSIMWANNETGVLQPIPEIAQVVRAHGALMHTDATQAIGKIPVDSSLVNLLSLSAHKFYGPKGVGALIAQQNVKLSLQMHGGGHERGRRSGTLNVPAIVGMGAAAQIAQTTDHTLIASLRNELENAILATIPHTFVNGNITHRLPNTTNICFEDTDGEQLLLNLNRIAVSNGSACTSASILPSHVLKAMALTDAQAHASIRFSLGHTTTVQDIARTVEHLHLVIGKLRRSSH